MLVSYGGMGTVSRLADCGVGPRRFLGVWHCLHTTPPSRLRRATSPHAGAAWGVRFATTSLRTGLAMTGGLDGLRRGWQLVRGRSCLQAARPVVVPCKNAPFNVVYSHKCVSLRGAKRRGNPSARLPARIPSVTAPPCHLPLRRGGLGGAALCSLWRGTRECGNDST